MCTHAINARLTRLLSFIPADRQDSYFVIFDSKIPIYNVDVPIYGANTEYGT